MVGIASKNAPTITPNAESPRTIHNKHSPNPLITTSDAIQNGAGIKLITYKKAPINMLFRLHANHNLFFSLLMLFSLFLYY